MLRTRNHCDLQLEQLDSQPDRFEELVNQAVVPVPRTRGVWFRFHARMGLIQRVGGTARHLHARRLIRRIQRNA